MTILILRHINWKGGASAGKAQHRPERRNINWKGGTSAGKAEHQLERCIMTIKSNMLHGSCNTSQPGSNGLP
jgi:hypothetical protein